MKSIVERPKVGVGVCVRKDGKILMGKRKGGYEPGAWCFPGGHLEMNEHPETCAIRETREEINIKIKNLRFITFTSDLYTSAGAHYITLFYVADWSHGEVQLMEPDKCEEWNWFKWNKLPEPLFLSTRNFVAPGINPLEI